jgi:hypothetical protein
VYLQRERELKLHTRFVCIYRERVKECICGFYVSSNRRERERVKAIYCICERERELKLCICEAKPAVRETRENAGGAQKKKTGQPANTRDMRKRGRVSADLVSTEV